MKDQRNYRTTKHHPGKLHQDGKRLMTSVGLHIVEWQVGHDRFLLFHTFSNKPSFSSTFIVLFCLLCDNRARHSKITGIMKLEFVVRLVSSMTSLCFYGNWLVTLLCVITMTRITYNTPSWVVSDLQSDTTCPQDQ